jgi:hypothetical protein
MTKTIRRRSGRPRIDPRTRARIVELFQAGETMRTICRQLELEGTAVSYNTIRDVIKREAPTDPSAPWRLKAAEGLADERPDLVVQVLSGVVQVTEGRVTSMGTRLADWIVALRLAVPSLSAWGCYLLARRYLADELAGLDTRHLDQVTLFASIYASRPSVDLKESPIKDERLSMLLNQVVSPGILERTGIGLRVTEGTVDKEVPREDK